MRVSCFAARRAVASFALAFGLAACTTTPPPPPVQPQPVRPAIAPVDLMRYAEVTDEPFAVPAIPEHILKPEYIRQLVNYPTSEPPGTIIVDPENRFLYLVQEDGAALRYGVGVGRQGMAWSGTARVGAKREWPRWTPTPAMIKRDPEKYAQWKNGMDGGDRNPLGARALYLFKDGQDTLYRIHGTELPETIGHAASSGCIRLMNQDIIDLYSRVPSGTRVVVLPVESAPPPPSS